MLDSPTTVVDPITDNTLARVSIPNTFAIFDIGFDITKYPAFSLEFLQFTR